METILNNYLAILNALLVALGMFIINNFRINIKTLEKKLDNKLGQLVDEKTCRLRCQALAEMKTVYDERYKIIEKKLEDLIISQAKIEQFLRNKGGEIK